MKKLSNHLQNVDEYYLESDIEIKRRIIKAIFPENFVMENEGYRTRRLNEGAAFVYALNGILEAKKEGTNYDFNSLSLLVPPEGIEPPILMPIFYLIMLSQSEATAFSNQSFGFDGMFKQCLTLLLHYFSNGVGTVLERCWNDVGTILIESTSFQYRFNPVSAPCQHTTQPKVVLQLSYFVSRINNTL